MTWPQGSAIMSRSAPSSPRDLAGWWVTPAVTNPAPTKMKAIPQM